MSELPEFACREDQVGTSFLKLTVTDFVVGIVMTELVNWLWRVFADKSEFSASGETVSLLYFQSLAWVSLLFYPFLAVLMPLIFYIRFKYGYYVFHYHRRVPNESYASSVVLVIV